MIHLRRSKLQKCRALGRELLGEFSIDEEEATSPRRRPQSEMPDLTPVTVGSRETVDTLADCVCGVGGEGVLVEDGQPPPAGTIVESPQRGHVVHWRLLDPVSGSLLELVHVDAVGSFARRLHSRGSPRDGTPATPTQPYGMTGSATSSQSSEADGPRNEDDARIDARVLPTTRDKAGSRQRSFAEAVATISETCWPITGPRTFLWYVFILTHYTSLEARHSRWLVETKA